MKKTIKEIISLDEDNARIYPVCQKCVGAVEFFGGKPFEKAVVCYVV